MKIDYKAVVKEILDSRKENGASCIIKNVDVEN